MLLKLLEYKHDDKKKINIDINTDSRKETKRQTDILTESSYFVRKRCCLGTCRAALSTKEVKQEANHHNAEKTCGIQDVHLNQSYITLEVSSYALLSRPN